MSADTADEVTGARMVTAEAIALFLLGGKAVFTLVSGRTGARFTYRLHDDKDDPHVYFAELLTGSNNTEDYRYLGLLVVRADNHRLVFKATKKSIAKEGSPSFEALAWVFALINSGELQAVLDGNRIEFWHEGRCARCGRPLTVPASLATGYGPDCYERIGGGA